MIAPVLLIQLLLPLTEAFFPIGPVCGCPPLHPACPPNPACPMHGIPVQQIQPIQPLPIPDELEMRAAALGLPINQQVRAPTNLEQFEKFLERQEAIFAATAQPATAPTTVQEHSLTTTAATIKSEEALDQLLPTTPIPTANSKCNSQTLRKIMLDNITSNSSESKRRINTAAEAQFGGNVDVICSRGHFSYVFSSNLYCEAAKDLVTCIAFRQTATV